MQGFTKQDFEQFQEIREYVLLNHQLLTAQNALLEKMMALFTAEVSVIQSIDSNVKTIASEVQALQTAAAAAGTPPDTSTLDAALSSLQSDVQTLVGSAAPASTSSTTNNPTTPGTPVTSTPSKS